jgi:hypothetical protein
MTHLSEDELLRHALDAHASATERSSALSHLEQCAECRARLSAIDDDVSVIAGVSPRRSVVRVTIPRPVRLTWSSLLQAAALVILGIAIGYSVSATRATPPAPVAPAYVSLNPIPDSLRGIAASDATATPEVYLPTRSHTGQ